MLFVVSKTMQAFDLSIPVDDINDAFREAHAYNFNAISSATVGLVLTSAAIGGTDKAIVVFTQICKQKFSQVGYSHHSQLRETYVQQEKMPSRGDLILTTKSPGWNFIRKFERGVK